MSSNANTPQEPHLQPQRQQPSLFDTLPAAITAVTATGGAPIVPAGDPLTIGTCTRCGRGTVTSVREDHGERGRLCRWTCDAPDCYVKGWVV